jgi:ribosomal protein L37E
VTIVRSLRDLFRRQPPQETPCPRCGVPAPEGRIECAACGWDLRDAYREPVADSAKDPLTG